MVTSQVMSLGWLPSVGSWLHTGEDSRVSHSKVKEGLFREETHSIHRVLAISEGKRGTRVWGLSVFIGVSNFMKVTQSCLTICDPKNCIVPGILQARILEWAPFPFSRVSSQCRDWTQVSCIAGRFFTSWATVQFSQFSRLVVSDSLWSHESQHARPPCPSPTLGVHSNLHPSHPLLSPFPPAPNPSQHQSFPMSQLFAWGGQSTGVSALASFLPKNTQGWSPLEWIGWIFLHKGSPIS